jgi:hypothetical protein
MASPTRSTAKTAKNTRKPPSKKAPSKKAAPKVKPTPKKKKPTPKKKTTVVVAPRPTRLDAFKQVIEFVVDGKAPSKQLLETVQSYLGSMQEGVDLITLVMSHYNFSRLGGLFGAIEEVQKELFEPKRLKDDLKDKNYGIKLLQLLYRESNVSIAYMEAKGGRMVEGDPAAVMQSVNPSIGASPDAMQKISATNPQQRDKLRGLLTKLLEDKPLVEMVEEEEEPTDQ